MSSIKCGNCKGTHGSVADVKACYGTQQGSVSPARVGALISAGASNSSQGNVDRWAGFAEPVVQPATDNQRAFLKRLVAERVLPQGNAAIEPLADMASLTKQQASAAIEALKDQPKRDEDKIARDSTDEPTEFGMYRQARTGDLFRVYPARQGGHLLSKRLIILEDGTATFMYAGAAKRQVKASERMSLEEAKAFGHQFGVCCMCAAVLTDPESVAAGIGPICAGKV